MTTATRRSEDGSVLIEALIAAALVAMILLATFQVLSDSARRRERVLAQRDAVAIARARLEAVGSALPLTPGRIEGVEGGYHWSLVITPCSGDVRSRAGELRCATVTVRKPDQTAPLVSLTTRRVTGNARDA
ncbi:hypothetical protein V7S57_13490 [Caulobacter sp. CCNWLY153]|uniref:PulJ/GspJ family protein n=1 Tax=unclassified Caulobacter TaxID=2648921 RepID=UPI002FF39B59